MKEREMAEWIEAEMRRHPWADEDTARRIVEDNLRDDIHWYDKALNRDQRMAEDDADPFPERDEREERRERRHGKPGAVAIVFGAKPAKDDADPFPED